MNAAALRGTGASVTCYCPASAKQGGSVWGTGIYTGDSTICRAALHGGMITLNGGPVTVTPVPGRSRYPGDSRNGVSTGKSGSSPGSFTFAK